MSHFHLILEREINTNTWCANNDSLDSQIDVFFASVYTLSDDRWAVMRRLQTSACDWTSAVSLLRELLSLIGEGKKEELELQREVEEEMEVGLGIEDYIPPGKANKPFWARGVDMLGYSLNSLRLANLNFKGIDAQIITRLQTRGIKLCGLLAAAGLIAAHSSNCLPDQWQKYAVVTLTDCRSMLHPVLSCRNFGFYHSAIVNTHDIEEGENLWELAKRTYMSFANAKNNQKHFWDMNDLNFLMVKAIDNPGLTRSSSLRTSLISVFEDPVIDHSDELHQEIGLEDYIGCASVHNVGPSIAIFDTIRDGELDCACVYPSPLHSREQMLELIDDMKRILVNGSNYVESDS
ncbi:unnamed protein product [Ilex paraguariensis]|uniref:Uncharacterized protein n=1 Tax=Ilex paraguariensis TaxID=185542 RepID=A0ABC8SS27_9AQUA